ncbi:MAG: BamA/TamA family outer membrane protein [Acidobacteriota bacterium]
MRFLVVAAIVFCLLPTPAQAQYFGRNKVQWENFHFRVLQTEHFDIYYYDQESDVVNDIGRQAERWYARLSRVFNHTFERKPIVLYANPADFQQTTTTGEILGQGTGGFTDEYMNRVVLPLTGDYAENDHVLGHELVHVFQYDIARAQTAGNNNRRRFNLEQMPLWLVEGMAEYFSKGRVDTLTAMWVRDATIHNRLPDLRKLTRDPRYFPYRYGEALLAYIGGRFGDDAVVRYFLAAGTIGIEPAFDRVLGLSPQQVFTDWQESARELYNPVAQERPASLGNPILGKKTTRGDLNVGPAISPDGRYIAFLSTRELFDIDLFLADASTGKVLRRLVSTDRDAHFDALRFIDSAGTWSPDSQRLAIVTFAKGDNYLGIANVAGGRLEQIRIPGLDAITNVAWSPDGHSIAISGQQTGVTDLFIYDLTTKQLRQLTSDRFADLQPAWSPDGKTIAFVSDRGPGTTIEQLKFSQMRISTIDVDSGRIQTLPLFDNAKHISPQYSPDGSSIYFIANPEGVADVYRYVFSAGMIERVTHVQTGVAGITEMSPALSVAAKTGELAFSLFEDDDYNIYTLPGSTPGTPTVTTAGAETPRAALLPPLRQTGSLITEYLQRPGEGLLPEGTTFRQLPVSSALHLAYVGAPSVGVGVGVGGGGGYGVGGSVAAFFSDVLGHNNVGFTFIGTGTGTGSFLDQLGGDLFYLNQSHRFNYGAELTHIPYAYTSAGFTGKQTVTVNGQPVQADVYEQQTIIQTVDNVTTLAQYPFTSTRRIEGSVGYQRYATKADFDRIFVVGNTVVGEERGHFPGKFSLNLFTASTAFVGDSSVFGFVSPVRGTRYRYEAQALTGDLRFSTALADYRRYFFFRPTTIAIRGLHYGRYGTDAESPDLTPLYVGDIGLMRGYDPYGIGPGECVGATSFSNCAVFQRLTGSRLAIASVEARTPILGTKEYGLINAPYIPVEGFAFADAGTAWSAGQHPKLKFVNHDSTTLNIPVFSVGVGLRILLSYIPIEVYAAKPFQRPAQDVVYGFNIIPGW